jgi:hypothetical protein
MTIGAEFYTHDPAPLPCEKISGFPAIAPLLKNHLDCFFNMGGLASQKIFDPQAPWPHNLPGAGK